MRRLPAIVVDFGTAITFDVIDASACYLGGIIAPGLVTAASALHERTALLPLTQISAITSPVGKSTAEAIRIGLLLGAVGLIRESVARITRDIFDGKKPTVIATGGMRSWSEASPWTVLEKTRYSMQIPSSPSGACW